MPENESALFRKSSLERVSSPDQLNEYIKVTSPNLIVLLVGIFTILIAGAIWIFSGAIPKTVDMPGVIATDVYGNQKVYCFVPIGTSKRLETGMEVQISPDYANKEEYGYIKGHILSVGKDVINEQYLTQNFANPQIVVNLAAEAMARSNVVTIEVSLEQWSNEKGNAIDVTEGSLCSVSAIVGQTKPYELMF